METQGIVSDHSSNGYRRGTNRRDGSGHRNSGGYQQRWMSNESTGSSSSAPAAVVKNRGPEGSGKAIVEIAGSSLAARNGTPSVAYESSRAWSKVHSVDMKPNSDQGAKTISNSIRSSSGVGGGSRSGMAVEQSFVPYLPQDDAIMAGLGEREGGVDAAETQEVTDLLNEQLSALLCLPPRQFWKKGLLPLGLDHVKQMTLACQFCHNCRKSDVCSLICMYKENAFSFTVVLCFITSRVSMSNLLLCDQS